MKPSSIAIALETLVRNRRPGMIWGPPGVGKSEVMAQVADKLKIEFRDVRLSLLDPTDLKGFPMLQDIKPPERPEVKFEELPPKPAKMSAAERKAYDDACAVVRDRNLAATNAADTAYQHLLDTFSGKQMAWAIPDFLPTHGEGILFLDELPAAPQSVQAAAYQLVLDRRIGNYQVPDGWAIMSAGNRTGDRAVSHTMPSPLANRFVHIDFEIDHDDWHTWAVQNGVNDMVRGFLRFRPNLLHAQDTQKNDKAFPTPRSWRFMNDIISHGLPADVEYELAKGTVGEGAASEFLAFSKTFADLPSVDEVLMNPDSAPIPSTPAGRYAICTALDRHTTKVTIPRMMKYCERLETEYQVLFMRSAGTANREITSTPEFTKWITKNRDVIVG